MDARSPTNYVSNMASGQVLRAASARVPFLDLSATHHGLKAHILGEISDLIDSGAFTNGPQVATFETEFARVCDRQHCIGVASGLDALRLALLAAGLERGEEVIVPAQTFVATFEAVTQAGGVPVPVDITEEDYNLDVESAEGAISARTRFLLPVHLYGQMADVYQLCGLAERHGIDIMEDACQALGAQRAGVRAGNSGLAAAFSFYPAKNLGAMGDAGALVTDDAELASRVRALREHGQTAKHHHDLEGYTSRLDTLQALVLLQKLPFLDQWNEQRRTAARLYSEALAGIGDLRLPPIANASDPVWHLYVVRTRDPESLAEFLTARGVGSGRHYPNPPHLSPAYARLGYSRGSFPTAEALAAECLSLPIFPGITEEQIEVVVQAVTAFFGDG